MTGLGALALTVTSLTLAAACAGTDGAMLAVDPDAAHDPRARALLARRERVHRSLAFARVISQLVAGIAVASTFDLWRRPALQGVAIAALAAVILVGTTESVARSLGDAAGEVGLTRLLPFARLLDSLLAPVATLGSWIDDALHRLLPPPTPAEEAREATAQQFKQIVATEAEVSKDQEVLLNGVFSLGQREAQELMVPRVDVVGLDRETPWSEVVDRIRSSEFSRLPVYGETLDDVIGVLYAKDMLPAILADTEPERGWLSLVRAASFIPAAKKADAQLRDFQASHTHMAIVVDEFGGTAGILTIEDVLEEIVGDIRDEYDEEEPFVEQEDHQRYWVSARLPLAELSDLLGQSFERDEVHTVSGLIYEHLGRVPRAGEEFYLDGFRIVVERVVRRRVQRVYFERVVTEDAE